jgi:hypothetical protein
MTKLWFYSRPEAEIDRKYIAVLHRFEPHLSVSFTWVWKNHSSSSRGTRNQKWKCIEGKVLLLGLERCLLSRKQIQLRCSPAIVIKSYFFQSRHKNKLKIMSFDFMGFSSSFIQFLFSSFYTHDEEEILRNQLIASWENWKT